MANHHQHHLSELDLIRAANGELSAKQRTRVEEHFAECWQCRHERAAIERAIDGFMAIRSRQLPPQLPPSEPKVGELAALLASLPAQPSSPVWLGFFQSAEVLWRAHRPAWMAAVSAGLCLVVVWLAIFNPAVVAAEVLLSKAKEAQASTSVAYQELSVRVDNKTYHRRIVRGRARTASQEEPAAADAAILQEAGIDWNNPLSLAAFSRWRAGTRSRQDHVQRDHDRLTLTTKSAESGPVEEAALTVRSADFWPTAESWRLASGNVIEIVELSSRSEIPADLLPSVATSHVTSSPPVKNTPDVPATETAPALPSAGQLAVGELAVRTVLHNLGADLGEDITIQRGARHVEVRVRVETEARKQEIAGALQSVSLVEADVRTFAEDSVNSVGPTGAPLVILAAPRPLLAEELAARFPDAIERREFVNRALALSQQAVQAGFALKKLGDRYTPAEMELLGPGGRDTLQLLIRAHLEALDRNATALASSLQPLNLTGKGGQSQEKDQSRPAVSGWRDQASRLTARVSQTHKLLVESLSGGGSTVGADSAKEQIAASLAALPAEFDKLRHQLSQEFSGQIQPKP